MGMGYDFTVDTFTRGAARLAFACVRFGNEVGAFDNSTDEVTTGS